MANLNSAIRTILTSTGKNNDAYWGLGRVIRSLQTDFAQTYATVTSAWTEEAEKAKETEGRALMDAPAESTIRQLGAATKLWGNVADERHSPFHAYAWRSLAYNVAPDGKRTVKEGAELVAAWNSIPTSRPKPKPTAPTATVSVKLPKSLAERLQGMADAAGVDVADVIIALLPNA